MFVHPITLTGKSPCRTAFRSKVIWEDPRSCISKELKDSVDDFEERRYLYKKLGEGKCSSVYELKPEQYVIKTPSRDYKDFDNFANEAEALIKIPPSLDCSQHYTARVKTEKNNFFLVSTYKNGKPANLYSNPLTPDKINLVMDSLFNLDKAGIYHNDLTSHNILFEPGAANIIDYQWAASFKPFNSQSENNERGILFPKDVIPSNLQNYEIFGISSYLHRLFKALGKTSARKFLKVYIKEKSVYHKKRYEYFKDYAIKEGLYYNENTNKTAETASERKHNYLSYKPLKYERALSKVYENPTEDVVDIELLRMEMMRAEKKAFRYIDPNNTEKINTLNGLPYTANAILSAKHYQSKLNEFADKYQYDKYMSRYIKYNKEIADFSIQNYKSWYPGTLRFYTRLVENDYRIDRSRRLSEKENNIKHFEPFKTFDPIMSVELKRQRFNSSPYFKFFDDETQEKYIQELYSGTQKLVNIEGLKNYVILDDDKRVNVYNKMKDIERAAQA